MLPALLLSLAVTASAPHTSVLVTRRTSLSPAEANALAQRISKLLTAAGVKLELDADAARASLGRLGLNDAAQCNGRKACITELGRQLQSTHVLSLSVSQVGSDRSIALELLLIDGASVLEREALVVSKGSDVGAEQLAPFAAKLKARLAPPVEDKPVAEPPAPPPVVVVENEKPATEPPPPAVVVVTGPAPAPRSRVLPLVLGVAAAAALVAAAVACLAGAMQRQDAYRTESIGGVLRSPYSASEVQSRAASASVLLGLGAGAGALALGLAVAVVVTW